jgi:tRNA(Ile)-lysidine synthase
MYLNQERIEQKFKNTLTLVTCGIWSSRFGIAVSGGVDSIALLLLMHKIAPEINAKPVVFTVDHGLRSDSLSEAAYTASLASDLGLPCIWLTCEPGHIDANIQSKAREFRYKILIKACNLIDVTTLLTAHHGDDELENLIIRNERKSGICGLSPARSTFLGGVRILRPLYEFSKRDLISYVLSRKIGWKEDPSNLSIKYHRNFIRKELFNKTEEFRIGLRIKLHDIEKEAQKLALDLVSAKANYISIYPQGYAKINLLGFNSLCFEVRLNLLHRILTVVGARKFLPRARSSIPLLLEIKNRKHLHYSLHGCQLRISENYLWIIREFGRNNPERAMIKNGVIWDDRFHLRIISNYIDDSKVYISHPTLDDYKHISKFICPIESIIKTSKIDPNNASRVFFSLPIIRDIEKVLAVPHICYYDIEISGSLVYEFIFKPPFVFKFTNFC